MVVDSNADNKWVGTVDAEGEYTVVTEMGYVGLTREESDTNLCTVV